MIDSSGNVCHEDVVCKKANQNVNIAATLTSGLLQINDVTLYFSIKICNTRSETCFWLEVGSSQILSIKTLGLSHPCIPYYVRNIEELDTQFTSSSILAEPLRICMLKAERVGVVMAKNRNQQSH